MPKPIWERFDDEPNGEFEKFRIYLTLDRANRTLRQAWVAYLASGGGDNNARSRGHKRDTRARSLTPRANTTATPAPGYWYLLSESRRWEERARAFDTNEDRLIEKSLRDRRLQTLVETADVGRLLRQKGSEALALLRSTTEVLEQQEDGSMVTIRSPLLSADEIVRLIKVGAELEAVALGMPGGRMAVVSTEDDQAARALEHAHDELKLRLADIKSRQTQALALLAAGPELPNVPMPVGNGGGDDGSTGSIQSIVHDLPPERLGDPATFGPSEEFVRRKRRNAANQPQSTGRDARPENPKGTSMGTRTPRRMGG